MPGVSFYNLPAEYRYLLEEYTGHNVAASVRRISPNYTGPAMTIRRASDNQETDIGYIGDDLDTAAIIAHCTGTDGFVTTWYDQSTVNRNFTNSTAAAQPKIYDNATGVITKNGKPALLFDGVNDRMFTPIFTQLQPLTIYAVAAFQTVAIFKTIAGHGNAPVMGTGSPAKYRIFAGVTLADGNADTNQKILIGIANGASSSISVNNLLTTGNAGASGSNLNFFIGDRSAGGNVFNGYIQEVVCFNNNQSANSVGITNNAKNYFKTF